MEIGAILFSGIKGIIGIVYPPIRKRYFDQPKVQIRIIGEANRLIPEFVNEDFYQYPENQMNRLQKVNSVWKRYLVLINHSEHTAYNLKLLTELDKEYFEIEPALDRYRPLKTNDEISHSFKVKGTITRRESEAKSSYPQPEYLNNLKLIIEYTNISGSKFYTRFDNALAEEEKNRFLKRI